MSFDAPSEPPAPTGGDSDAPSQQPSSAPSRPADPLHYANVLSLAERALGSAPQDALPRTQTELVAAVLHAAMVALGFRCIGIGEEGEPGAAGAAAAQAGDSGAEQDPTMPAGWNTQAAYAFRYRHPQSSLTFLVKSLRMADRILVHGMAVEDGKLRSFEIPISTHLVPPLAATYPVTPSVLSAPRAPGSDSPLLAYFRSAQSLQDMLNLFKIQIVQRIAPGLQKEGYEETAVEPPATGTSSSAQPRPRPVAPPYPIGGGIPDYPRRPPPYLPGPAYGPRFGGIGSRDLDPFAGGYPGPGGLRLPGGGYGPMGGGPPGFGGGGMFVGPNDPMFGRRDPMGGSFGYPEPGFPYPEPGPLAGPGGTRLPPGAVPPGARFDPIVPGAPPGTEGGSGGRPMPPGSFPGPGRSLGGTGPGPGRTLPGEPDNDDAPPPEFDNMFT
ncbi:PI31 proteasome regulator N-terminal-domain-containing protein [Hyaloraphidium curvatum]|nr:PI31 proteasome regulator N-terminal-domain-containing protein [Hyaloraphidium curvatum]